VITGEGAFVETASSFDEYPEKIRKKLRKETTVQLTKNEGKNFLPIQPLKAQLLVEN